VALVSYLFQKATRGLSRIFNITGPGVALVCDYTGNFYDQMMTRKDRFYRSVLGVDNDVISLLFSVV